MSFGAAFAVSPSVTVREFDLTNIIPAVSTAIGATVVYGRWGAIDQIKLISSEADLVSFIQKPDALHAESFFTAASFLKYGRSLKVIRAGDTSGGSGLYKNASANADDYSLVLFDNAGAQTMSTTVLWLDKTENATLPTSDDALNSFLITVNGEQVAISDYDYTGDASYIQITLSTALTSAPADNDTAVVVNAPGNELIKNEDEFEMTTGLTDDLYARYAGALGNSLLISIIDSTNWGTSPYADQFDSAPTGDEVHIIVIDEDGKFSGTAGTILEKWAFLQTTDGAKRDDGANNYVVDVVNANSNWFYINNIPAVGSYSLTGGADTDAAGIAEAGNITAAFDLFNDVENVDISLIFSSVLDADGSNLIMNKVHEIAYSRKDCVGFMSPPLADVLGNDKLVDVLDWAAGITVRDADGSYGVANTSAHYVYDKYRDKYLWIGTGGVDAGLCANTDNVAEPWFSPAGYNRGSVKGVVKTAYLPNRAARDELYKFGVNFYQNQPGTGLVLFGDKTLQAKPSAFDRINVRRLFIVLEKAIATAAKFQLFELNDEFTRAIFRNMVEPFLRDVKGRRGMTDYYVVCDETNNTGEVIDRNAFVADIYIKPARSINFITLNFVAVRTGVAFSEVIGLTE